MNVLLINGSPHKKGCTYTALSEVAGQLEKNGIGSNIVHIGSKPIRGCIACGACRETGLCVFDDDPVNECSGLLKAADGLIVGSPVYYAAPNGALCAFLDRLFYMKSGAYAYKPAAAVVSCRRADVIFGPVGIVIADALLGEVTPRMAVAVGQSAAKRILIPVNHCANFIAGVADLSVGRLIDSVVAELEKTVCRA